MPPARLASPLLAILLAAVTGTASAATGPDVTGHQAEIDKIVADISPQRIEAYVRKLVSFGTRHAMSDTASDTRGIGAARRWIKGELARCGAGTRLQVAFDRFVTPVGPAHFAPDRDRQRGRDPARHAGSVEGSHLRGQRPLRFD
jgi:hypothetical protein